MKENNNIELTQADVDLLNSKYGLRKLFSKKQTDVHKALKNIRNDQIIEELQVEMVKLQSWVIQNKQKVVIVFEGRDAAGKGGAIRRIAEHINPRHYRSVALNKPNEDEKGQWYFQRYINQLPKAGEIVFFDRSWYNRAVVEPVNGFCTEEEHQTFMNQVNQFEKMLIESNTYLIKLYFSINKEEQKKRFDEIKKSDLKRWKMSPVDEKAQELWDVYTAYKKVMFEKTNTDYAPWKMIDANKKSEARISAFNHILETIPYK